MISSLVNSLKDVFRTGFQGRQMTNVLNYECRQPELAFINALYSNRTNIQKSDKEAEIVAG